MSLKRFVDDITNWRKMLSGEPQSIDLVKLKNELSEHIPEELKQYILVDNTVTEIRYPVNKYPSKIKELKTRKESSHRRRVIRNKRSIFNSRR